LHSAPATAQAFSRTNRLFGPDKPFGTIRYYRKPHTMQRNIDGAVKLYSGDKPMGLFAEKLASNVARLNACLAEISAIFAAAGIADFKKLPDDPAERAAFAKHFQNFSAILEAARIQGFAWEQTEHPCEGAGAVILEATQQQYFTLLQRYKELGSSGGGGGEEVPFEIDSHISEIDTGKIDADYMNSRFAKYLKVLQSGDAEARDATLSELQRSFASLSQEEQKFAEIFLRDMQRGDVVTDPALSFRDYLTDYQAQAKHQEIEAIVKCLGVDVSKLNALLDTRTTEANLNEYGRFDALLATIDKEKAKVYFSALEGQNIPAFKLNIKAADLLRTFIIQGGFELSSSGE
jgi:type I restriction enzyme R subunit